MRSHRVLLSDFSRAIYLSCLALAAPLGMQAHAQGYPERAVRIVVPFAPGGSTDIVGRIASQKLGERLKQSVVIDNRGGGGGNIGSDLVAKAPPDGYTLLVGTVGSLTINPSLYRKMPYDPLRDLTPIAYFGSTPNILVVHPSLPARTVSELIALARARPGQLNYASAGTGGSVHLAAELFRSLAKIDMVHVPYKGSGPALIDLIAGQTQLMFSTMPPALPHVKSGRLRALGMTGTKRSPLVPDLPTIAESGLPGYEITQWWGLLGPAGLPPAVVTRLNNEMNAILKEPEVRQRFASEGAETAPNTPDWFAAYMKAEVAKWAKVVRASGATAD
jgi:tripartite-type tricarboxylate transporter receptor subunit TctC